jgi:hypothetical protein
LAISATWGIRWNTWPDRSSKAAIIGVTSRLEPQSEYHRPDDLPKLIAAVVDVETTIEIEEHAEQRLRLAAHVAGQP